MKGLGMLQLNSIIFFNDTATTEIYTLSLPDALPICHNLKYWQLAPYVGFGADAHSFNGDRKSTRLNSSHLGISYAVFCLKIVRHASVTSSTYTQSRETCGSPNSGYSPAGP